MCTKAEARIAENAAKKGLSKQAESTPRKVAPLPKIKGATQLLHPFTTGAAPHMGHPLSALPKLRAAHTPWVQVLSSRPMRQGFKKKRASGKHNSKEGRAGA